MFDNFRTIRRHDWLIALLAIGLVLVLPILGMANKCPLPAESSESLLSDGENFELDESLDLMLLLCSSPKLHSLGQQERVADDMVCNNLVLAAIHFERGPPLC